MTIMVSDIIKMFGMLQEVEIYPICDPKYPNTFFYEEEINPEKPIYTGMIKDMPTYLTVCKVDEPNTPECDCIFDCRRYGEGGTIIVFSVIEPENN